MTEYRRVPLGANVVVGNAYPQQRGYQIDLQATVSRARDDVIISEGHVSIWLADLQQHGHADYDV